MFPISPLLMAVRYYYLVEYTPVVSVKLNSQAFVHSTKQSLNYTVSS